MRHGKAMIAAMVISAVGFMPPNIDLKSNKKEKNKGWTSGNAQKRRRKINKNKKGRRKK